MQNSSHVPYNVCNHGSDIIIMSPAYIKGVWGEEGVSYEGLAHWVSSKLCLPQISQ